MVKIQYSHCHGLGSNPGWGTEILPTKPPDQNKKKKKKEKNLKHYKIPFSDT